MRFSIAGMTLNVKGLERLPTSWRNYEPFIATADDGQAKTICEMECGHCPWDADGEPVVSNAFDGKTLRLWVKPDGIAVSLRFHGDDATYHLRANRDWSEVKTDCLPTTGLGCLALGDFLMISFIYSSAYHDTVLVHGSCVRLGDASALFIGPSGVGKSTHSRLWTQHVKGAELLNDDQPALRVLPDGKVYVYGTPWSGKTPCYINGGARLKAVFRMAQAAANKAVFLDGANSFCALLDMTSLIKADISTFSKISDTVARVAEKVGVCVLYNLPDKAAVETSYGIFNSDNHCADV